MFISKAEKTAIKETVASIDEVLTELIEIVKGINDRVGVLEQTINALPKDSVVSIEHKRAKQREYARTYYARKKAAKQKESVLETQE